MLSNLPHLTTIRAVAIQTFEQNRKKAQRDSLWTKLFAGQPHLESFAEQALRLDSARKYLGLQEIPVEQITGSVGRSKDFDRNFRPLKKHLCGRWVGIFLRAEVNGWPPIRVYKAGEQYFVEDGHHRVSVARTLGMLSLQAEVWEYALKPSRPAPAQLDPVRSTPACQVNSASAQCG